MGVIMLVVILKSAVLLIVFQPSLILLCALLSIILQSDIRVSGVQQNVVAPVVF
jgi:hypothetical protein